MKSFKRLIIIIPVVFCFYMIASGKDKKCSNYYNDQFRPHNQRSVLQLKVDPIPTVRVGFIGLGMRGAPAVYRYTFIEGVEIKALCDLNQHYIDRAQKELTVKNLPKADEYVGEEAWKRLCERPDIDLIYICTDWQTHVPMAVYAMEQGKHVAVEVPAAMTVKECWDLVNTAERTQRHCMMLENCCYDFFELTTLNMAQQGVFGEIVHVEGAYIHDLRELNFNEFGDYGYYNQWRLKYNEKHTGNPYPTHGLGPVCQVLNIHRGDKMNFLVSVSSGQFGMTEYAKQRFGADSPEAQKKYARGDMNTTIIRTEKGKTIMIQHDVTSPRPYSRLHAISGTKGFAQKYPVKRIALEPDAHNFLNQVKMDSIMKKYEHPFIQEIGDKARKVGGHGGMDFIMDYRLIYCLRNGLPLDQDVYDAAEWSCIVELSEQSVLKGGFPVKIPDFTRGEWNKLPGLKFAK